MIDALGPQMMRAMIVDQPQRSLKAVDLATPSPGTGQVLVRVEACGVCRTDLHIVDGELRHGRDPTTSDPPPIVPGHEIVGTVVACGAGADRYTVGTRVGVPWLGWTCGECAFCTSGRENLCS